MQFELIPSPLLYPKRELVDHTTVAVDILRATTSICAAFQSGVECVVPLDSLDPLPNYYAQGYTLAAERDGRKLPLAECGNSPTDYLAHSLQGRRLAYSTTNGTVAILCAVGSSHLYVGAFANISRVAQQLLTDQLPVVVLCSGWKGMPCIEDTLFAGALIHHLQQHTTDLQLVNDSAQMALDLYLQALPDLYAYCAKATHVHRLQKLHYDVDIRFALRSDTCPVLPYYDRLTQSLRLV